MDMYPMLFYMSITRFWLVQNDMPMYFQKFTIMLGLAIVLLLVPFSTNAQTHSVAPLIIDLELEKRDIIYREVTITNQGSRQVRIFPSVNAISLDDNGAIESFVEPAMIDDRTAAVTSWIEVPRGRIEIPAGESKTIPITFRVPPEVTPGEYHAIIGFGNGSNQPEAHAKVIAGTAPGTIVRIGVDIVQSQFLRLERFVVERFVTSNQEGTIRYVLHNPGEDPVTPGGEIIIYDNNGTEVYSLPVNPKQLVVEPNKNVEVIDSAPTDLRMGKYKAFLSVEYGKNLTASVHDTAFFYVMPIKQLLIVFGILLILAIAIALYVHRRYDIDDGYDDAMLADVPLFVRSERSESKDHDIDLSKKA